MKARLHQQDKSAVVYDIASSLKPALLYLCHRIPYPPDKGDKIRSFHILKQLAQHYRVHLGAFVDDSADWEHQASLSQYCESIKLVGRPRSSLLRACMMGLIRNQPLSIEAYASAAMQKWVDQCLVENDIQRTMVYSAAPARFVINNTAHLQRSVIDLVDVDSAKWEQYASQKSFPSNWLYRREARLLKAFENGCKQAFNDCLLVSSAEARLFSERSQGISGHIDYVNNGVDASYFAHDKNRCNPFPADTLPIVFTGAMDYWPNVDAVNWFCESVLPMLVRQNPLWHFTIVGSNPAKSVERLAQHPNVTVTGRVPDVRPYLQHACTVVTPLRVARGIQNKVLEAMAMQAVVVSSDEAMEGIDARAGLHYLRANTREEFVDALHSVTQQRHSKMGERARRFTLEAFDWQTSLAKLKPLLI